MKEQLEILRQASIINKNAKIGEDYVFSGFDPEKRALYELLDRMLDRIESLEARAVVISSK
jgi:hypothetical protein